MSKPTMGGAPWWITPAGYQQVRDRLIQRRSRKRFSSDEAGGDDEGMGEPTRDARPRLSGGVAVIPVYGAIYRHDTMINLYDSICFGGTCSEDIRAAVAEAVSSPLVKSILLTFDSPGGECSGIADLAASIRLAATRKPTMAFAEGDCCSAAYYLASACGEIAASPSARVGSIGTVWCLYDDTEAMKILGIEEIVIVSTQSPRKWPDPATEEGRAQYQETVDALTAQFIADVARYRGVTTAKVASDFGKGGTMIGPAAKSAGMVDRIGTFDATLAKLNGPNRGRLAVSSPAVAAIAQETAAHEKLAQATQEATSRLKLIAQPRRPITARLVPR